MAEEENVIQHPRRSYILLLAANLTWVFGVYLYSNFIGLYMREELGANSVQVGYWSTVFLISVLLFTGLGGLLTAKLGEKQTMLLGWLVVIPAPLIYILAPSWHLVLVGAFLEGASMIVSAPIGAYITSLSGGGRRGRAFGLFAASIALGGIPSPVLGGIIITMFNYVIVFFIAGLLYIISTLLILPISSIPTTKEERSQQRSWDFLKNRVFISITLFWFSVTTMYWIANMFIPLFLYDRWGLTEAQIGFLGSITNTSGTILGPLMGWLGDRWSYTGALIFPVLGTFGFYALLVVNPLVTFLPFIYLVSGFVHCFSLNSAVLSHNISRGQLPDALAVYNLVGRSLSPLSPIIGGVAFSVTPSLPLVIASIFTPIPSIMLYFMYRAVKKIRKAKKEEKNGLVPLPIEDIHPPI